MKRGCLLTIVILVSLLSSFVALAPAAADITLPEECYGDITVNGEVAPAGSVVVAKINGVQRGSLTTAAAGSYGGPDTFDDRLVVAGQEGEVGQTVTFWVDGYQADETAVFTPGLSRELDLTVWAYPLASDDTPVTGALAYLASKQQSDSSIGGLAVSSWAVMGIAAAGQDPDDWTAGGDSIVDYLRANAAAGLDEDTATDWERTLLAIVAAGGNPRSFGGIDYVDKVTTFYDGTQVGDDTMLNDDFWGLLALAAIGESDAIQNSCTFVISNQNADGGWGWTVGGSSDADNTAAAVAALLAAGHSSSSSVITDALDYIKTQQQSSGGFTSEGVTNSAVDAWVMNAIVAAGQSPVASGWRKSGNTALGHLLGLQSADGSFRWTASQSSNPEWMTAYALIALSGNGWPADATPPVISGLTPASGSSTSSTSPTVSAALADATSAIDISSVVMLLDGADVTASATVAATGISYTAASLAEGSHTVSVTVSDKAGNEETISWSFQVASDSESSGGGGGGGGGIAGKISFTEVITEEGEIVTEVTGESDDGRVHITVFKNTLARNRVGSMLSSIIVTESDDPPSPPSQANIIGLVYDMWPDGATFDPPIEVTFEYSASELPDGVAEEDLVVAVWDDDTGTWEELPCTVDPDSNTVTVLVSHFTDFAVVVHTRPAEFTIGGLTVSASEIDIGETVTVTVTVTNGGDLRGAYTAGLEVNGVLDQTEEAEIDGGDSESLSFEVTGDTAGEYTVSVAGLSGSFTVREPAVAAPVPPPPTSLPEPEMEIPPVSPPEPAAPAATPEPAAPVANETGNDNMLVIGIVAGAAVVTILLVFFVFFRRRGY